MTVFESVFEMCESDSRSCGERERSVTAPHRPARRRWICICAKNGTSVTARPDEQFGPNKPILSALALYMLARSRMDALGASNGRPSVGRGRGGFFTL